MREVRCRSGLRRHEGKLQENYDSYVEWVEYARFYGLHTRLGFKSPKSAWLTNPVIRWSVIPGDFCVVSTGSPPPAKKTKQVCNMSRIGVPHPKADPTCSACCGRGWAIFLRAGAGEYPECEGLLTVQACDDCDVLSGDAAAAELALEAGILCHRSYPCVLLRQPRTKERTAMLRARRRKANVK